eukprot:841165-Amorphochlora_amoeboformis.AAC.1
MEKKEASEDRGACESGGAWARATYCLGVKGKEDVPAKADGEGDKEEAKKECGTSGDMVR